MIAYRYSLALPPRLDHARQAWPAELAERLEEDPAVVSWRAQDPSQTWRERGAGPGAPAAFETRARILELDIAVELPADLDQAHARIRNLAGRFGEQTSIARWPIELEPVDPLPLEPAPAPAEELEPALEPDPIEPLPFDPPPGRLG